MKKTTILIVDDELINLTALSQLLQEAAYLVRAANSGERALRVAASEPRPELILLDVMMPRLDGYSVLERLKASPVTSNIPVIFVTALGSEADEQRGFDLGAVDYITKPFRPAVVLARVRTQLELKLARDRLANQNEWLEMQVRQRTEALEQANLQLLQSEKLAAIGQLAAGVAHEINNPLSFVSSNMESLVRYVADLDAIITQGEHCAEDVNTQPACDEFRRLVIEKDLAFLREDLDALFTDTRDGLERIKRIVADLKDFARADQNEWQWADLHHCLDSTLNVARNEIKYKAEVIKEYGELPQIWCLPSRLNQVFMNLLVNAAQSISERGTITVRTGREGERIRVEIADTGSGIAPEHLKRLFQPFFTTKPAGTGTGLGLSLSQSIVQKHHGEITVDSHPGEGSNFRVWLPITQDQGVSPLAKSVKLIS